MNRMKPETEMRNMVTEATPRNDEELAEAYNLGLADLGGKPDGLLARKMSGHERRLGKAGPILWALLPACVQAHRNSDSVAPSFDRLVEHERHALRYIAIAIEHGRASISISMAMAANGQPLYFEQALMLTDAIEKQRLLRATDGRVVVAGPKWFGKDILGMAVDILEVCKETGIEPIPTSPNAPRRAKRARSKS
ncbi:MAG: hypothetical protein ABJ246_00415 [Paracoccaceae bacterium]